MLLVFDYVLTYALKAEIFSLESHQSALAENFRRHEIIMIVHTHSEVEY